MPAARPQKITLAEMRAAAVPRVIRAQVLIGRDSGMVSIKPSKMG
jgi:hypothetical protein